MIKTSYLNQLVILGTIGLFSLIPSTAYSQSVCTNNNPTQKSIKYSKIFIDAPVIDSENINLQSSQWSQPVITKDSFTETENIVVFDRDYQRGFIRGEVAEKGVYSAWGQKGIKAISFLTYNNNRNTSEASDLSIKINEQIFNLTKIKGVFFMPDKVQEALNVSPVPKVSMRITTSDSTTHTVNIGEKTIQSWQSIKARLKTLDSQNDACQPNFSH